LIRVLGIQKDKYSSEYRFKEEIYDTARLQQLDCCKINILPKVIEKIQYGRPDLEEKI
jgi:hypothetical protein